MPISETMGRFNDLFWTRFVGKSAENVFKAEVRKFTTHFSPRHVQLAAESGRPFAEIIAASGFKITPTPVEKLNPWQKHLVSLPDEALLQLVREAVSPEHAVMLDKYPQVAAGLVQTVKNMVLGES